MIAQYGKSFYREPMRVKHGDPHQVQGAQMPQDRFREKEWCGLESQNLKIPMPTSALGGPMSLKAYVTACRCEGAVFERQI